VRFASSDEHFRRGWVTEESVGACCGAVGPRLKHGDEISRVRFSEFDPVAEEVQRGAKRADDRCGFAVRSGDSIPDADGVVLAYDLPEKPPVFHDHAPEHDPEKLGTFRTRSCSKSKTSERCSIQLDTTAL